MDNQEQQRRVAQQMLSTALRDRDLALVKICLAKGADLNAPVEEKLLPLQRAIREQNSSGIDFIKGLLDLGADPLLQNANMQNSFDYARERHFNSGSATTRIVLEQILRLMFESLPDIDAGPAKEFKSSVSGLRIEKPLQIKKPDLNKSGDGKKGLKL